MSPIEPLDDPDTDRTAETASVPLDLAAVREFAALVEAETGVDLSDQEAWDRAIELVTLVRMLICPIPEDPGSRRR